MQVLSYDEKSQVQRWTVRSRDCRLQMKRCKPLR